MDMHNPKNKNKTDKRASEIISNQTFNHKDLSETFKLILEDKLIYRVEKERRPFLFNNEKVDRNYKDILHLIDQGKLYNNTVEERRMHRCNPIVAAERMDYVVNKFIEQLYQKTSCGKWNCKYDL